MLVSSAIMFVILLVFNSSFLQGNNIVTYEPELVSKETIPSVMIRQDSLIHLLNYFTDQNSSSYSADTAADKIFILHLSRFSSTPSVFYCNNSALPSIIDKEFKITINQNNKEVDAVFMRKEIDGIYYVKVPTDVLCGLLNFHPNIR